MKSCNCDNCYWDIDKCQVVEVKPVEDVKVVEVEFRTKKCPGVISDCDVKLWDDEDLCENCLEQHHILEVRREEMEDQAVAAWEERQSLLEEQQWLKWEEEGEEKGNEDDEEDDEDEYWG